MSALYPFLLEPKVTAAIWGGDALVKQFGKAGDPDAKLGEAWECWDENRVLNGALAGKTLADLRRELGADLMGDLDTRERFPLLTKVIDARDALSVQVHPDDAYARRVESQRNGKTECWYVLSAEPGAELVLGWNADTDRAEYERRVADGSLGELLRRVPVQAGDAFFLPAGTLHAIGAGIVIFETQQASDLTYRIFDWNRVDAQGKGRELHVEKAGDVLDFGRCAFGAIAGLPYTHEGLARTLLIADERFVVERLEPAAGRFAVATEGRPLIFTALAHPVELACEGGSVTLRPYQTAVVPAAAGSVWVDSPGGQVMLATPPAGLSGLASRLASAGVPVEQREAFLARFDCRAIA